MSKIEIGDRVLINSYPLMNWEDIEEEIFISLPYPVEGVITYIEYKEDNLDFDFATIKTKEKLPLSDNGILLDEDDNKDYLWSYLLNQFDHISNLLETKEWV